MSSTKYAVYTFSYKAENSVIKNTTNIFSLNRCTRIFKHLLTHPTDPIFLINILRFKYFDPAVFQNEGNVYYFVFFLLHNS